MRYMLANYDGWNCLSIRMIYEIPIKEMLGEIL